MTRAATLALLLGCAPPPRPPPPTLTRELATLDRAHARLKRDAAADQLDAAEIRLALARTTAQRRRAYAAYLVARHDVRSAP